MEVVEAFMEASTSTSVHGSRQNVHKLPWKPWNIDYNRSFHELAWKLSLLPLKLPSFQWKLPRVSMEALTNFHGSRLWKLPWKR